MVVLNLYPVYLKMSLERVLKRYSLRKMYKISGGSCSQPRTLYSLKPGMGLEGEDAVKRVF